MKTLFIVPEVRLDGNPTIFPFWAGILASIVEEKKGDVAILDLNALRVNHGGKLVPVDIIEKEISSEKWDIIGIGGLTTTYGRIKQLAPLIKKNAKESLFIAGGGWSTYNPDEILQLVPELDLICLITLSLTGKPSLFIIVNLPMKPFLSKWFQTMQVSWSNLMVYKLNFFLQIIGPMLVFFFIKLSLWSSIYGGYDYVKIGGYTLSEMLSYHLWVMIAGMIIMSSTASNLSEDIRLGKISSYLIYPFSFWEFHTAKYLARQVIQIVIALVTIVSCYFLLDRLYIAFEPVSLSIGIFVALLAGYYWFAVNYLIGILAFWLDETWTIMVGLQIMTYFFSGAIIPLELFPETMVEILYWTPFPYISFVPAKILMGHIPPLLPVIGVLGFWSLLITMISYLVWKKGLSLYTAAGM